MPERRLYDVECIEALYARCDELEGVVTGIIDWYDKDGSVGGLVEPIDAALNSMEKSYGKS